MTEMKISGAKNEEPLILSPDLIVPQDDMHTDREDLVCAVPHDCSLRKEIDLNNPITIMICALPICKTLKRRAGEESSREVHKHDVEGRTVEFRIHDLALSHRPRWECSSRVRDLSESYHDVWKEDSPRSQPRKYTLR